MKASIVLSGRLISFAIICMAASSANAQCAPDTLAVTSVSGKVVAELNKGETPLDNAVVTLKRGGNFGPVVAQQEVNKDGGFGFRVKPGKYQLKVSVPHLSDFYLDLRVRGPKADKVRKEIVVIMGADFTKECSGSSAELRIAGK
jgi:hypothetical protein